MRYGAIAAGAAILGLLAVASPSYALAAVFAIAYVIAAFRNLALGCALFAILIFFGQIGSGGGIKAAGAVLVAAWLARAARDRSTPFLLRSHPVVAYAAVSFLAVGGASALWAASAGTAVSTMIRVALGVVLLFVLVAAIDTVPRLQLVLGGLLIGAFISAVVGVLSGTPADSTTTTVEDANRLAGQVGDAITFAAILVPALLVSAFWAGATRSPLGRIALTAGALLFTLALVLTGSRGGLVALGACFVGTIFLAGPVRARAIAVMTVVGSVIVTYYALFAPPQALGRITHFAAGGGAGRTDLWSVALEIFRAHPILGIGAGNFQIVEAHYAFSAIDLPRVDLIIDTPKVAHNTYLQILTELGVVGFIPFALLVFGAVWSMWRAVRIASEAGDLQLEVISRGLLIGTLGMLAAITFFSAHTEKELWYVLGIALALSTVASRAAGRLRVPAYDRDVQDDVAEALERRIDQRVDALLAEQDRLARRRAQLAELERELRERQRSLDAESLDERERALAEREREVARREEEGLALARAIVRDRGELEAARARAQRESDEAVAELRGDLADAHAEIERLRSELERLEQSASAAPPAPLVETRPAEAPATPVEPAPGAPPASTDPGGWNLGELEAWLDTEGAIWPERVDDWAAYLFYLRDYAEPDGSLPASFDALLDEVFGSVVRR